MKMVKQHLKQSVDAVRSKASVFKSEVKKNVLTAILAAFGFIIALVWRDAIQAGVNKLIESTGVNGSSYLSQLIIASFVTIICVVVILFFSKLKGKEDIKV